MSTPLPSKSPVLIGFVCPVCAGENGAHLISLSRQGGMDCAACGRWLRASDVMRALHAPRTARPADAEPVRTRGAHAPEPVASPLRGSGAREAPSRRDAIVWPPTAESRAAANRRAPRA